ncbi:hypothetical protein LUW74_24480 [Actinomadura madurae]|uniref:hypothetical protein n=1 Tax=Actinomadura madurae TaxID=1993 RepID=UPI0020275A2D|nr:hypothetical protein [Actinomadura madurae]URN06161.1 hypothetical protein LUW74_24480 [Actinomadura madurae]
MPPKKKHELPLEMVRRQPQLVPTILRTVFDLEFPDQADATISSESFADFEPAELRCDATVLLDDPSKPSHGVVVEVQTRFEKGKLYSWPAYLATLRRRYKCGTTLLVICPDPARKLLEEMVKTAGYEWQSDWAKSHRAEGRAEGEAQGEAKALLLMMEARGLVVSDEIRERVTGCTDTDQLERWVKRAAVIDKAEDLLD